MFRKFALTVLSLACLGMIVVAPGCGGPGEAETISEDQRPPELNKPGEDGAKSGNKGPGGEDMPEGVAFDK